MSSKLLEKQIKESDIFKTAQYNKDKDTYFIPKSTILRPEKYHSYIIEIDDSLLAEMGDEITQCNWNKGKIPDSKYYKVDIENIVGKMLFCIGIGYDIVNAKELPTYWKGYFPKDKVKVLSEL